MPVKSTRRRMESPDPLKVDEVCCSELLHLYFKLFHHYIDPKHEIWTQAQNLRRRQKVKVMLQKRQKQGPVVEMSTPPTPSTTPPTTTPTKVRLVRRGNFGTNYQRTPGDSWPTKSWATWRPANSSSFISKLWVITIFLTYVLYTYFFFQFWRQRICTKKIT